MTLRYCEASKMNGKPKPLASPRRRLAPETVAAEILNVEPQSLRNARATGLGDLATLRWFKVGKKVLYDLDYLEGPWLERRQRGHAV
jgi:hypothetical protein